MQHILMAAGWTEYQASCLSPILWSLVALAVLSEAARAAPPDGYRYCSTRGTVDGLHEQRKQQLSQKRPSKRENEKQNISRDRRRYG